MKGVDGKGVFTLKGPKWVSPTVRADGLEMAEIRDQVEAHPFRVRRWVYCRRFARAINPVGMNVEERKDAAAEKRELQRDSARAFLVGEESFEPPPYGKDWGRCYNPYPYPEAVPKDLEMYAGTPIGFFYG